MVLRLLKVLGEEEGAGTGVRGFLVADLRVEALAEGDFVTFRVLVDLVGDVLTGPAEDEMG